jgi:methyl-accepting chemotaxis protein
VEQPEEASSTGVEADLPEGFLDAIITISQAGTDLTERLERIGNSTEEIGATFQETTTTVQDVQQEGGPGMVLKMHRLAGDMGAALDAYAQQLGQEAPR